MLPINLNFIQNQKNYKKKELMIYVALATKPEKLQKNIHVTIYIHVRLDIAPMEGDLYPLWFLKNIYQPVQLIASLL